MERANKIRERTAMKSVSSNKHHDIEQDTGRSNKIKERVPWRTWVMEDMSSNRHHDIQDLSMEEGQRNDE